MNTRVAIVTGASSGLGFEIASNLKQRGFFVLNWDLNTGVDVSHEANIQAEVKVTVGRWHKIEVIVNCAGVNHIEWIPQTKGEDWDRVMNTNSKGIFLMAKHCAPIMQGGTICNIISSASHIPMTASITYNASKAAAAMMTRQMARELFKTHNITVFGVSPNKLRNTAMSQETDMRVPIVRDWDAKYAEDYSRKALLIGEETDPIVLADFVGHLLEHKTRHKYLAGCILEYGL